MYSFVVAEADSRRQARHWPPGADLWIARGFVWPPMVLIGWVDVDQNMVVYHLPTGKSAILSLIRLSKWVQIRLRFAILKPGFGNCG